jgi:hypothetical protein
MMMMILFFVFDGIPTMLSREHVIMMSHSITIILAAAAAAAAATSVTAIVMMNVIHGISTIQQV